MNNDRIDVINPNRGISRNINSARNTKNTNEYKRNVQNRYKKERERRKIKNNPKILKLKKKFVIIGMIALVAGDTYVATQIPEYKEAAAENVLETVKEELGADKIYDNSSLTSSNTAIDEYVVQKDGKIYRYVAYINDGEKEIKEDTIKNGETVHAISIAAKAQNGTLIDAIIANRYANKIEKEKINLTVGENTIEDKQIEDGEER